MYHPLPLNWSPGAEIRRSTSPPQPSCTVSGESLNFCRTSYTLPHLEHLYSYKGILFRKLPRSLHAQAALENQILDLLLRLRRCSVVSRIVVIVRSLGRLSLHHVRSYARILDRLTARPV